MSTPSAFILPLKGLGKGFYEYDLEVDDAFFAAFPESPIRRASVGLHLIVDKQSREMVVDFDFGGTIATACDRCLADIDLPIQDRRQLIVKFSVEADAQQDEGDIVYLHPDTNDFNLAPFVYEMVVLSVPMIRTYDCQTGEPPYPCDEDMLERIDASYDSPSEAPTPQAGDGNKSSPWDVLKDLNKN
ncbi:uncharacterized metal-binding protein YceD (DUF177 family) [Lewinella marina]|uniref:DUF177 domain-containing protein n=1 Tax=Neolewinella marina TaxID=438751 RepID=A0A2G0CI22_9BACT|nr:DUF177 domain-containing protein [Neolewinella marina]NJB85307.1 uncharacterized metal-binding protein YceD (DUF177 family) [Neolewinella marina]PHK99577.1 hypothetical protein CGL56_00535 [Neolewinella marina]